MVKAAERKTPARRRGSSAGDLTDYIWAAMRHAKYQWASDDRIFIGTSPPCRGVIGTGKSLEACRDDLQEVLEEWLVLGFRLGHDLPVVDGVDLNYSREPATNA